MDQSVEISSILPEEKIITEEEKARILADIDGEFLNNPDHSYNLEQFSAHSHGLFMPASIAVISIIITFFILLFASKSFARVNENSLFSVSANISGSEWEILKIYIKESTQKLETKNLEINEYKDEIVTYDQKLTTLRELLDFKKETESRLAGERIKLEQEGFTEEDIGLIIAEIEEKVFSDLAPGMVEFYNLGIDGINKQIDQILDDKTESEENLKLSLDQREVLITEKEKLEKDILIKESEISSDPEVIEAMNTISDTAYQNEYNNLINERINVLYNGIFKSMDIGEYDLAMVKIDDLQNLIQNNLQLDDGSDNNQLPLQIKIADTLKKYLDQILDPKDLSLPDKSVNEKLIDKIAVITDKMTNSYEGGSLKSVETELRSVISSSPAISKAFTILSDIDEQEFSDTNRFREQSKTGFIEDNPLSNDPGELILFGMISIIQFDYIIIDSISGFEVYSDTKFHVFNRKNQAEKLGTGIITNISGGSISGLLLSFSSSFRLPEADDLIFLDPDNLDKK